MWISFCQDLNLDEAFEVAEGLADQYVEVGIFLDGYVYWTSRIPDLFNSTVLNLDPQGASFMH
ncbi:MAG: hypothetical protein IPK82_08505 [Polyangiaceae bacterium]|nr:hypothetical protein [Polyangiaceae bacterium]